MIENEPVIFRRIPNAAIHLYTKGNHTANKLFTDPENEVFAEVKGGYLKIRPNNDTSRTDTRWKGIFSNDVSISVVGAKLICGDFTEPALAAE